jgi:hypothetical protein
MCELRTYLVTQSRLGILPMSLLEPPCRKSNYPYKEFGVISVLLHIVTENLEIETDIRL